jgi:hypothetical protein
MSNPVRLYHREMHKQIGFFANWLPGDPIAIGAIGVLADGRFRQESSLSELDIPCKESEPGFPQDVGYTSSSGVKLNTSAQGSVAATAKAEISIEFSENGAFIFQAIGLRGRQLANRASVTKAILEADDSERWQSSWLLVDGLHIADCATIIVSEGSGAGLTLAAQADGPISAAALADAKLGLHVTSSRGRLVQVICGKKLRPLYHCVRLSGGWLPGSKRRLESRGRSFAPVEVSKLLES